MSEVYALGIIGDPEIRYVGATKYSGTTRLRQHLSSVRRSNSRQHLRDWLADNDGRIEARTIEMHTDFAAALQAEKVVITKLLAAGNRLLNYGCVPADQKDAAYTHVGKEVLHHGKHFADAADIFSAVKIVSALNAAERRPA